MSITWEQFGRNLVNRSILERIPIAGQFELTARCNLKCKMCYVCESGNDMSTQKKERTASEWIKLAQEAKNAGMLYLLLTGGEIFIRNDFKEIYEELSKMGFNIELYTNATMITPEIANWLGKMPPSRIGITLYGASPETYHRVTGNANAYYQATRGVDLLLSEGIKIWLKTTVIHDNAEDFNKLTEFADNRGIKFGVVNYVSPRRDGTGTNPQSERLSPLELIEYEKHANIYFNNNSEKDSDKSKTNNCSEEFESIIPKVSYESYDAFKCPSGKAAFWVTWDGKMTPCSLLNSPSTLPFENGFSNAWENLKKLCSLVPSCSTCNNCSLKDYCMTCPARLQAETGSFEKPSQYLCDLALLNKSL